MTQPTFVTRVATEADREQIATLDDEARTDALRHRGATLLFDELGSFEARWSTVPRERTIHVAEVSSTIVGFVSVVIGGRPRPLLESVFVTAQARQLGIGAALLREAITRHGTAHLDALSLPGDRLTKNLYERGGLKARLIVASAL